MADGRGLPSGVRARFGTVRVRATAASVLLVGLALVVGATGLIVVLQRSLTDQAQSAAELRAAVVAAALDAGRSPGQVAQGEDEVLIQVVDVDGRVLASTPNGSSDAPVRTLDSGGAARITAGPPGDPEQFLTVTRPARFQDADVVVLVGRSLEPVRESSGVVIGLLAVGLPLLLAVVGATTWWIAGRVLARVEAVRAEVEEISAAELHRRVPVRTGHDEISRLAATMNTMLSRLEHSQREQRRFVSDASHEIRSPLAAIRQHAEVAVAHPASTSSGELGAAVRDEALRVQALVDDLLLLARSDEGGLRRRRDPVDLDDLVLDEVRRLRETTTHRVDATGVSAAQVRGDALHLGRVVRNLVDNAGRHATGVVALRLTEDDGHATLVVEDDGPGIPDAERHRVLERFVRLDAARSRDAGGSGLGLAIVAEVVAAHGGTVEVGDGARGGTRVTVVLPTGDVAPVEPARPARGISRR